MSYCRFENTLGDLRDCAEALAEGDGEQLSEHEERAKKALIALCVEIAKEHGSEFGEIDPDDPNGTQRR